MDAAEARAHFDLPADARVLLAMGGSLGAGPLNGALKLHLDALLADERTVVIWAAGKRYYDTLRAAVPDHPRLRLVPYLDRMDLAYAAADLALCRSGAITCNCTPSVPIFMALSLTRVRARCVSRWKGLPCSARHTAR